MIVKMTILAYGNIILELTLILYVFTKVIDFTTASILLNL